MLTITTFDTDLAPNMALHKYSEQVNEIAAIEPII